jgi:hypothetical protein
MSSSSIHPPTCRSLSEQSSNVSLALFHHYKDTALGVIDNSFNVEVKSSDYAPLDKDSLPLDFQSVQGQTAITEAIQVFMRKRETHGSAAGSTQLDEGGGDTDTGGSAASHVTVTRDHVAGKEPYRPYHQDGTGLPTSLTTWRRPGGRGRRY